MAINTLNDLYELTKEKLEGQHGTITVTFANRNHVYTGNDVIGNCLQEWLPDWFQFLGVNIQSGKGTQVFPDFIAHFNGIEYAVEVILSILVDTFISKISLPMQPVPEIRSISGA